MVGGACRAAGNLPVWTLMTVHWWPVTFTGGFSLCPTCVYSRHNQQRLLCSRQQLLPNTWPAIFPHVCLQALEPIQSVQLRRVGAKCKVERAVKWNFPFWHAGICWEDRSLVTLLTMLQEEAPPTPPIFFLWKNKKHTECEHGFMSNEDHPIFMTCLEICKPSPRPNRDFCHQGNWMCAFKLWRSYGSALPVSTWKHPPPPLTAWRMHGWVAYRVSNCVSSFVINCYVEFLV